MSTQEFLVERCLEDDQQLLDALAPDPLLGTDLLTLDESTLKAQLPDISESLPLAVEDTITSCDNLNDEVEILKVPRELHEEDGKPELRRTKKQNECLDGGDITCKLCFTENIY